MLYSSGTTHRPRSINDDTDDTWYDGITGSTELLQLLLRQAV